tara:strand:+ start:429 stop:1376 length:948 start_codon:yes stop_codon:yes gene_type:complete
MLKTAESVTPLHPDKICDRISDTILDECLKQDPDTRAAIETMGGHNIITVTGELTTKAFVNIPFLVRELYGDVGVQVNISQQSPKIAQGVDTGGAGDQGIMIGYACSENTDMVPQEYYLARKLAQYLYKYYEQDGKTQVTLTDDNKVKVVASFCCSSTDKLEYMCKKFFRKQKYEIDTLHCNPSGEWDIGGFDADTGLTGRKLAVDNYGPRVPLGGGAFSGKDATKVDRSGAYMARKIAVDYLKKYNADEVMVRLAYAIGYNEPLESTVIVDGTPSIIKGYDLSPNSIIKTLDLKKPIYSKTAEWGHMGNNFNWK